MILETIKGISRALFNEFGSKYAIYKEDIPQNFKEPCFSITHIRGTNDLKLTGRYIRRNRFNVHYFPKKGEHEKEEIYNVIERLFSCLEYINVLDNLCGGAKMSPEIVDGVLHFFVDYDFFVVEKRECEDNSMKSIGSTIKLEE